MGVVFEAVDAAQGDCLLLRFPHAGGRERLWIVDGGPRGGRRDGRPFHPWRDALLPRLRELRPGQGTIEADLGVVTHVDDDHVGGQKELLEAATRARPGSPAPVRFRRFWFNALGAMVDDPATASLDAATVGDAFAQSVAQGDAVASHLRTLGLAGNPPFDGLVRARPDHPRTFVDGASVTILGPGEAHLAGLRELWAKERAKTAAAHARRAGAVEDGETAGLLAAPAKLDRAVANLSSIVMLVEVGGERLLLTGDAQGAEIVAAWKAFALDDAPVALDLVKMPHHGSARNVTEEFVATFAARHYVFSADGTHGHPDPGCVEAVVRTHHRRATTLHFTNREIRWEKPHRLGDGAPGEHAEAGDLATLLDHLALAHPGPWRAKFREPGHRSLVIDLA